MLTIIPMSQAHRRLRRLVALVAKGHTFIITKNGKPLVLLDAPKPSDQQEQCKRTGNTPCSSQPGIH
ncbi:type II toxin-antitoxin system Phd/YefM family antitoxin [Pseudomonas putida]